MVKHLFILILIPFFVFSSEFNASVNSNEINTGEGITLTLTLKEASAKNSPSIEFLKQSFSINSQQQSSSTVIINGKMTSSLIWKFVLIPKQEGEIIIPSISIESSQGILTSEPIKINVVKGKAGSQRFDKIHLKVETSNPEPYKNEPFFYTIKLNSPLPLANIQIPKIQIENAIVEMKEEPKVYEKVIDGILQAAVDFKYLITPLKVGNLSIPSILVQGGIPVKKNRTHYRSFFDHDFDLDPFSYMSGFSQLEPFGLGTEEMTINVLAPIAGIEPWLSAESISIDEIWDPNQKFQVGEFFNRKFKISAKGTVSNQLPNLNDFQLQGQHFKVYADQPELSDHVQGEQISSTRVENYTLVPEKSGVWSLPEIAISWWDVLEQEKKTAKIPSRTLTILPLAIENHPSEALETQRDLTNSLEVAKIETKFPAWMYILIGGLSVLLIIAILWGISLLKKINKILGKAKPTSFSENKNVKIKEKKTSKKESLDKTEKLNDLNPT